jgi:hypothetical protein
MQISDATMVLDALEAYFRRRERTPHGCAKVAYSSIEAKRALAQVRRKRNARGGLRGAERYTYKCWACGKWHLASGSR